MKFLNEVPKKSAITILLLFLCHDVFAQGLENFPTQLQLASKTDVPDQPQFFYQILCGGEHHQQLVSSARSDGIQVPTDFISALLQTWCEENITSQSDDLIARRALPFDYIGGDQKRRTLRSSEALRKEFGEYLMLGRGPYYFALIVSGGGKYVELKAVGGGDDYVFILSAGKWKVKKFVNGGGC